MAAKPPRLFLSYSHDSQQHKDWVLQLASRLVANGVDVLLDQWDLRLGANVQQFMESASVDSDRVLAICTPEYVEKANDLRGGVGYEKTILTAEMMKDLKSNRIIPLIRSNETDNILPRFLLGKMYIDFRQNELYEVKYSELIHEIHGVAIRPRPLIGTNPFVIKQPDLPPAISHQSSRYVSPGLQGHVSFDYSNNDGRYVIGAGVMAFETYWGEAGHGVIHALNDPPSIRTVALAQNVSDIRTIADATKFDASSRHRTAQEGDVVIWQNVSGYYAAVTIESVTTRRSPSRQHLIEFSYAIHPDKSHDFSTITLQED